MAVTLGLNTDALKVKENLDRSSSNLGRTLERLSSGQRINRASDDAAGLAVVSALNSRARVYAQGVRNLMDGISALNIADAALEQTSNIVTRLKELAEQAANGTFGVTQRKALDKEAQALKDEFYRIVKSTKFNQRSLLSGLDELRLQAGYSIDGSIGQSLGGALGTGAFSPATDVANNGSTSNFMTQGDFNGDGIIDLVTVTNNSALAVHFGNGDGTFRAGTTYTTSNVTNTAISAADVNNDGQLDLLVGGATGGAGRVVVLVNNGAGVFTTGGTFGVDSVSPNNMALADLNSDGNLDLYVVGASGNSSVLLGNGNGSFAARTSFFTGNGPGYGIGIADMNGDGILDLLAAGDDSGRGFLAIRLGLGNGTFAAPSIASDNVAVQWDLSVGDFNGDGRQDVMTSAGGVGNGYVNVWLGSGTGTVSAAVSYAMHTSTANTVTTGDLNGDGFLDMVSGSVTGGGVGEISVRLGTGDGTFGARSTFSNGFSTVLDAQLADLNLDGVYDILTGGYGGIYYSHLQSTQSGTAPLLSFSLGTIGEAKQALSQFTNKLRLLSEQRGVVGAFLSRATVAANVLRRAGDEMISAKDRIQSADIALETAQMVRLQILQNAGTAVMAQANLSAKIALSLLQER